MSGNVTDYLLNYSSSNKNLALKKDYFTGPTLVFLFLFFFMVGTALNATVHFYVMKSYYFSCRFVTLYITNNFKKTNFLCVN